MDKVLLIQSDAVAWARLTNGDRTFHLTLSLGDEFTGGKLVRLERGATLSIQGADDLALRYGFATWSCGMIQWCAFRIPILGDPSSGGADPRMFRATQFLRHGSCRSGKRHGDLQVGQPRPGGAGGVGVGRRHPIGKPPASECLTVPEPNQPSIPAPSPGSHPLSRNFGLTRVPRGDSNCRQGLLGGQPVAEIYVVLPLTAKVVEELAALGISHPEPLARPQSPSPRQVLTVVSGLPEMRVTVSRLPDKQWIRIDLTPARYERQRPAGSGTRST